MEKLPENPKPTTKPPAEDPKLRRILFNPVKVLR